MQADSGDTSATSDKQLAGAMLPDVVEISSGSSGSRSQGTGHSERASDGDSDSDPCDSTDETLDTEWQGGRQGGPRAQGSASRGAPPAPRKAASRHCLTVCSALLGAAALLVLLSCLVPGAF